jgi:aminopeptidase N
VPSLTRDEAAARADLLAVRSYDVDLDLTGAGDGTRFESTVRISFTCGRPGAGTFVEMKDGTPREVTLNGGRVDPASLVDNRLPLTGLAADNELVVRATMAYSNTGEGLHRFVDPADDAVYLYAQSFLDDAQRIFACFDQPDLKAPVRLTVSAPPQWQVAGNGAGTQVSPGRWEFVETPTLATYLVSLLAGPYHVRRDAHDGIALGLYCRRSLAEHLDRDAAELFGITAACFDRYHEMFGVRYPFGKYDQAFVPEFNAGAMENPGLVTFRDEYVFRSAVTDSERQERAEVIAHEMAHMWFGDLVTMRWWDDLWLNESFAEYMGYRVVVEATRFTGAWTDFAVGRKGWGYAADQRPSTHPVAPESLPDAGLALLNFDGISYAKGAAVLRQLAAWIGDEAFLAGLRTHFTRHAFGNATLDDWLASLSQASGRDLRGWADVWLRRAQVNTLRPRVGIDPDGRYCSVEVEQTAPPDHPTLRPHRIGIGVYSGGSLARRVLVDLDPAADGGVTAVPDLVAVAAGDLLLLNDGDLSYAKVRFDEATLAALPRTLPALTDPLARALVWGAVLDAVRDAEMPVADLIALCAVALPTEAELTVFRDVVRFATSSAVDQYLAPADQPAARATLGRACQRALEAAEPGGDWQLVAARGFVACADGDDAARLRTWLDGSGAPTGLRMDEEMRWTVLVRLAALGQLSEAEIEAEYERDRSAQGAEYAARCRAARPDPAAKSQAWRAIVTDDGLSNRIVRAGAVGFWQPGQEELTRSYVPRYFAEMPDMAARRSPQVAWEVAAGAFPRYAVDADTLAAANRLLASSDVNPVLARVVADEADDLRRALAARRTGRTAAEPGRAAAESGHAAAG